MALVCKNLGFSYEEQTWIFRNVDLTVEKGAVFGIAGQSGCGKTSLAKVLANHTRLSEGEVSIDGTDAEQIRAGGKRLFWPVQLIYQHPEKAVNPQWTIEKKAINLHRNFWNDSG